VDKKECPKEVANKPKECPRKFWKNWLQTKTRGHFLLVENPGGLEIEKDVDGKITK
jgi:hypothetical protein